MTALHRPGVCSVCGAGVLFEALAARTYEPATFEPHYCRNEDVVARLEVARERYLREAEVVEETREVTGTDGHFMGVPLD